MASHSLRTDDVGVAAHASKTRRYRTGQSLVGRPQHQLLQHEAQVPENYLEEKGSSYDSAVDRHSGRQVDVRALDYTQLFGLDQELTRWGYPTRGVQDAQRTVEIQDLGRNVGPHPRSRSQSQNGCDVFAALDSDCRWLRLAILVLS